MAIANGRAIGSSAATRHLQSAVVACCGCRRDHDNRRGDDRRGSGGGGGGGGQYRNRGGGGGNYDRQQQRGHRYQSSYIGQKRGRDEPEALDPKKQFILRLMRLGEPGQLSEVWLQMLGMLAVQA